MHADGYSGARGSLRPCMQRPKPNASVGYGRLLGSQREARCSCTQFVAV